MHATTNRHGSAPEHPVAVLRDEHRLMLTVVDAMERESRRMLAGGAVEPEFWRRVVEFLEHFLDRLHHEKEESVLFPELDRLGLAAKMESVLAAGILVGLPRPRPVPPVPPFAKANIACTIW